MLQHNILSNFHHFDYKSIKKIQIDANFCHQTIYYVHQLVAKCASPKHDVGLVQRDQTLRYHPTLGTDHKWISKSKQQHSCLKFNFVHKDNPCNEVPKYSLIVMIRKYTICGSAGGLIITWPPSNHPKKLHSKSSVRRRNSDASFIHKIVASRLNKWRRKIQKWRDLCLLRAENMVKLRWCE